MGIREKLNENPAVVTGIVAVILVLALGYIGWSLIGGGPPTTAGETAQFWYTSDGGQTFQAGEFDEVFEFEADGRTPKTRAVRYTWGDGGEPFVGYLERMSPEAIKAYQQAQSGTADGAPPMMMFEEIEMNGKFVSKPPGDKWVPAMSQAGIEIQNVPSQDGKRAQPFYPE